jgi:2'-5' RNA ligase
MVAGADRVTEVQAEVERRLAPLGFPTEKRPFQAHLTLGRFRTPGDRGARAAVGTAGIGEVGRCLVDRVMLYQSRLSPKGANYTPIAAGPLRS